MKEEVYDKRKERENRFKGTSHTAYSSVTLYVILCTLWYIYNAKLSMKEVCTLRFVDLGHHLVTLFFYSGGLCRNGFIVEIDEDKFCLFKGLWLKSSHSVLTTSLSQVWTKCFSSASDSSMNVWMLLTLHTVF